MPFILIWLYISRSSIFLCTLLQCRRCNPVGDNVTWPRITLQKTHWFLLQSCQVYTLVFVTFMPRHKIYASGNIVTRMHVYFATLQIIHWFLLRSCPGHLCLGMPGQDRNKNQCVFCNIILGQVTLSPKGSHLLHWSSLIFWRLVTTNLLITWWWCPQSILYFALNLTMKYLRHSYFIYSKTQFMAFYTESVIISRFWTFELWPWLGSCYLD